MNEHILNILSRGERLALGPFIKAIGIPIPCYPDLRSIFSHPNSLRLLSIEMARLLEGERIDAIAGCVMGGVPLAIALSMMLNKPYLCIRPNARGSQGRPAIEGAYRKGQQVVVVDDSLVTGRGKKRAVETLEKAGLKPTHIVVVMEIGGYPQWKNLRKWIEKKNLKVHSLVTWHEWAAYMQERGSISPEVAQTMLRLLETPPKWMKD